MKHALAVLCVLVQFSLPLRAETAGTVDPQRCGPCCQDAKRLCSDNKSQNPGQIYFPPQHSVNGDAKI